MAKKRTTLDWVVLVLVLVGAINWGLVGALNWNVETFINLIFFFFQILNMVYFLKHVDHLQTLIN